MQTNIRLSVAYGKWAQLLSQAKSRTFFPETIFLQLLQTVEL
jgi:hypothetical protein